MARTVSDALIARLHAWGVRRLFGYPGDGIDGVFGALARSQGKIEFVQARHEEMAAFMACGHAKFTGTVGACIATSGPGAIHLLTGLYDARLDRQPVVAVVGQQARSALGGSYQQEVDLAALFKDVAVYAQMVTEPQQLRHVVDRAFRTALADRGPACIIVPSDVQQLKAREPQHEHGTLHSGLGYRALHPLPDDADLERAAEILNAGKRVAILVGAGAAEARDEVMQVAELLAAGVAKALLGRAVIADELPYVTGCIGMLGTRPSYELMKNCDTLLMIGSNFPYAEFLPEEGAARGIQIDIDPRVLALRYPMELSLAGDAKATLRALVPLLQPKTPSSWRRDIERSVARWWRTTERRAMLRAHPVNPQRVFWELSPLIPDDALVACDTGTAAFWYARNLRLRPGMRTAHSGGLASMGAGLPYAIAAKFAYPELPAFAFVGDGAMQMNGLNELITVGKYWRRWDNPRFVVLVLNNRDLSMVSWEQRVLEGDPKFSASQDVPDFSYSDYATQVGMKGILIDRPQVIGDAWRDALTADRPVLVEALVDGNVPLLPPHISAGQARNYLSAILHGDRDAIKIIRSSIREILA